MMIRDNEVLKQMRKDPDKTKREHYYKVKDLTFRQSYSNSTDYYNPYSVYIYDSKQQYIASGSGPSIEDSYNNLIQGLIRYMLEYRDTSLKQSDTLSKISGLIGCCNSDEQDNRF